MKIFYIANVRLPTEKAHGIQIMKTCEALVANGMPVELIVPKRKTPIQDSPFVYYHIGTNFPITKLWCADTVYYGWFGFWLETLTFTSGVVWRLINQQEIFFTRDEFIAWGLKLMGKRVIWEAHMGQKNFFVRSLLKMNVKVIAIAGGIKDLCLELGAQPGNIKVIPDGVDLIEFDNTLTQKEARARLGFDKDKKLAIYTGSLQLRKGYETLQRARELLSSEIEIKIISGKKYQEIPLYLKSADILILPNSARDDISKIYTSPMKLFEYMASGRPIIASDVPALREVLTEADCYFFTPDNEKSLAQVIKHVLVHQEESSKKAEKALIKAREYTWEKRANKILEFIYD